MSDRASAPPPESALASALVEGRGRRGRGLRQERRPGSPRPHVHKVKVTAEQERRLLARAAERDITVSRLMVESALAGGADAARSRAELAGELFRAARVLGKVGVNVNQIARATNATRESQPETFAAMDAVERVAGRIEELLGDVEGRHGPNERGAGQ